MRHQHVVAHLQGSFEALDTRGMDAFIVPVECGAPRLVVRNPVFDAVAEMATHDIGVFNKCVHRIPVGPTALILQHLRQVPVVQRHPGLKPPLQHAINQTRVKVQALLIGYLTATLSKNARPGNRETVGIGAQVACNVEVLRPAVVVVTGHRATRSIPDSARPGTKTVPNGLTPAVLPNGSLNLIGRRGTPPSEVRWKIRSLKGGGI